MQVENQYLELVAALRGAVSIPLAVKIGPFFSSMANMAKRLFSAGADGLVLFNRFIQPDIDLDTLTVEPRLVLSSRDELWLPLRWIAILRSYFNQSLAATRGVHLPEDVTKLLLAGADVVMTTSAVLKNGPGVVSDLLVGLRTWMEEKEYVSVEQMKGSMSQRNSPTPRRSCGQLRQDDPVLQFENRVVKSNKPRKRDGIHPSLKPPRVSRGHKTL